MPTPKREPKLFLNVLPSREEVGLAALRQVLRSMRDDEQDGYTDVGPDGRFAGHARFVSCGVQVTPEQLDALFGLAGITPDPVVLLGHCSDCQHARPDGTSRGWSEPCVGCKGSSHDRFHPITEPRTPKSGMYEGCECTRCTDTRNARRVAGALKDTEGPKT